MAYLRPPWFQRRVFNPIATRLGIGGSIGLSVAGRRSGKTLTVPVIPVEVGGAKYLVSARGEAEWVRNLRAAGGKGQLRGEPFTAAEIPVAERASILEAYRRKAGRAVLSYFATLPDDSDHPVFRIAPRS